MAREFICPYDKCRKYYGSNVSLNLHIKLKHDGKKFNLELKDLNETKTHPINSASKSSEGKSITIW